ncbi:MAG: thioredoxin family protein [Kiritimatiellae bacterium]|nr:thioredoxin family protein [Kiritimatiellia bacterium]
MNTKLPMVLSAIVLTAASVIAAPDVKGARKGVWTQDFDAALSAAKAESAPLLINFTGSDWCGWCKLMDRKVFSTKQWKEWAPGHIFLAFIDFPQNGKLVPKKYVARNDKLAKEYGIRGYPTYIVIDAATSTKIGQLGASRDATPEDFIAKLEAIIKPAVEQLAPATADTKAE